MEIRLSYREERFTPSEAAAITGLALHLQRDWRSQGLLKAREAGRASFTPRELAEMRVMVKLRGVGLSLSESRQAAEEAAPGVIFAALANHQEKALAVEADPDRATAYIDALERESDDGYLRMIADLTETDQLYRYALIENGRCSLVSTLMDDIANEDEEAGALIKLWAIAKTIVEAAPRPLFTLLVPRSFRGV